MTVGELIAKLATVDLNLRIVTHHQEGNNIPDDVCEVEATEVYITDSLDCPGEKVIGIG